MSKKKKPLTVTEFARMGGQARKKSMTPERRQQIASQAARKRWGATGFWE